MFNYNLTSLISRSKRGLQIICLRGFTSTSSREAFVKYLTVCPRYAALKLVTGVFALHCDLLVSPGTMGYPSHARNRACALSPPLPFHYVMAKNVPALHLAAHAKSSTLYVRS